jgi:cytoskeleton protein RodZ
MNINNTDATENNDSPDLDSIGALLQSTRENKNENLNDVAKKLRIRQVYLAAIENNQFEVLPGGIYVIGFIKSYSKYLGLDSEVVIKRYKSEIGGHKYRIPLKFPAFVPENGIPGGSILLLGFIIAVIGYTGWYFFSVRNSFTTNQITSVPKPLTSLIKDKPLIALLSKKENITTQNKEDEKKVDTKVVVKDLKTLDNDNKNINEKIGRDDPVSSMNKPILEKLMPEIIESKPFNSQTSVKKILIPKTDILQEPDAKSEPTISTEPGEKLDLRVADEKKLEPSLEAANETRETSEIIITSNNEPNIEVSPEPSKQTQLPKASSSRIILVALADSYIQVRDNNVNQLLVTRLLRKGQRYEVPDRSGLTLITGNAGALKILVDGVVVPGIGPIGAIRRNVILDVVKLKGGLAVIE